MCLALPHALNCPIQGTSTFFQSLSFFSDLVSSYISHCIEACSMLMWAKNVKKLLVQTLLTIIKYILCVNHSIF